MTRITRAITSRMWMKPESVYPDTSPSSQRMRSITKMVQSMAASLSGASTPAVLRSESRASGVAARTSALAPFRFGARRPRLRTRGPRLRTRRPHRARKELFEHVGANRVALGHHVRAMDDVAKLAHVSRPTVRLEGVQGRRIPRRHARLLLFLDVAPE